MASVFDANPGRRPPVIPSDRERSSFPLRARTIDVDMGVRAPYPPCNPEASASLRRDPVRSRAQRQCRSDAMSSSRPRRARISRAAVMSVRARLPQPRGSSYLKGLVRTALFKRRSHDLGYPASSAAPSGMQPRRSRVGDRDLPLSVLVARRRTLRSPMWRSDRRRSGSSNM